MTMKERLGASLILLQSKIIKSGASMECNFFVQRTRKFDHFFVSTIGSSNRPKICAQQNCSLPQNLVLIAEDTRRAPKAQNNWGGGACTPRKVLNLKSLKCHSWNLAEDFTQF
jgi:hypothetical protein